MYIINYPFTAVFGRQHIGYELLIVVHRIFETVFSLEAEKLE